MPGRLYWIPALILWIVSTGWLFSTKIFPALAAGTPPDYDQLLPKTAVTRPEPVKWTIRWNDREIGWAVNKISRSFDGSGKIESSVQFEQLPVDDMLRDLMGVLGRFMGPATADIGELDLGVFTSLDFDNYGVLSHFETNVDVGTLANLLQIEGRMLDGKLDLAARIDSDGGQATEVYRNREISLPPNALVADTFSPRPKLANLRVGQTWTFQSYQPLMPHSPLSLIEARVEREELVEWNGAMVRTLKVVFQKDSGSGISSTRRPLSETWVMRDGTVLRQDLWIASVKVQFIRDAIQADAESPNVLPLDDEPSETASGDVDEEGAEMSPAAGAEAV